MSLRLHRVYHDLMCFRNAAIALNGACLEGPTGIAAGATAFTIEQKTQFVNYYEELLKAPCEKICEKNEGVGKPDRDIDFADYDIDRDCELMNWELAGCKATKAKAMPARPPAKVTAPPPPRDVEQPASGPLGPPQEKNKNRSLKSKKRKHHRATAAEQEESATPPPKKKRKKERKAEKRSRGPSPEHM